MKKLLLFTIALVLMLFAPVQAANVNTVKAAIVKHSIEMGVDPAITLSIAKTESGYRHEARSSHGAVGVFQLMPSTARRMGLNPYSLDDNIKGGIMYYKSMYKMFGSMELALAAYNAGPANVKKYKAIPPFSETRRFVSKIMADYHYLKAHTDPAVLAYKKQMVNKTPSKVNADMVAATPTSKLAPLPVAKIEQSRKLNVEIMKGDPVEVELKSQSVAI
ncbi:lytic transglycosylase domain-containing protein [bacterium]|nr:lytic transglycosylase domain-containing protein [bacterium]